jgi:hypothetical protein
MITMYDMASYFQAWLAGNDQRIFDRRLSLEAPAAYGQDSVGPELT